MQEMRRENALLEVELERREMERGIAQSTVEAGGWSGCFADHVFDSCPREVGDGGGTVPHVDDDDWVSDEAMSDEDYSDDGCDDGDCDDLGW